MPEITKNFVRIPVSGEAGKHEGHKIRTKTLSKKKGIKVLYCIDDKVLITYLFARSAPYSWTMSRAKAWVKAHKSASFIELGEDGKAVFCEFDDKGDLTEQYGIEKLEEQLPEKPQTDQIFTEERMIFLFGGVYEGTAESVCKKLLLYDRLDSKTPIKLVISSYGGSVYSSFAIIDTMEHVEAPIHTIGLGMVLSGGLLIFMSGDERYISQGASVLSHRFRTMKIGTQAELKADEKEDRLVHQRMLDHYKKFSSLNTDREVEAQLLKETNVWLSPEETIGFDLADDFFDNWSMKESSGGVDEVYDVEFILEAIGGSRALPIDKRGTWDATAATNRMKRAAGGPKKENMSWGKYQKGFVWYDSGDKENFGSYKLPFADIIGGKLTAVWGGVNAAMGAVQGARGGVKIPDRRAAYSFLAGYYKKFDKKPPKFQEALDDGISIEEGIEITEQILESIEINPIEERAAKGPFTFSGTVLRGDTESRNEKKRFYGMDIVRKAVGEVRDDPNKIKIMVGHPVKGQTSPATIVGKFTYIDMEEDGLVPFEAEIADTRLGKDAQEALKSGLWEDLSIRAEGASRVIRVDGKKRNDVIDLHFKGLDFVIEGGVKDSKVGSILSEELHTEDGGEENMTKKELLELEGVQELIAEAKQAIEEEKDKGSKETEDKLKETETKLAEANLRADNAEKVISDAKLKEYKDEKIEELDKPEEIKKLLRERVSGEKEEDIDKVISEELAYIDKVAPLLKEAEVKGIKPKEEDTEADEKSDRDILREGHPETFDLVEKLAKAGKL